MKTKIVLLTVLFCACFTFANAQRSISIKGAKAYISFPHGNMEIYCPPPKSKTCFKITAHELEQDVEIGAIVDVDIYDKDEVIRSVRAKLEELSDGADDEASWAILSPDEG